ncbi:MAG: crotonobetainyl-CoA--carnitine CoA-transferase [Candidatus Hodarchaeales archaeon]|jgi:hypothetical protein
MTPSKEFQIFSRASEEEKKTQFDFFKLFKSCPIPENELLSNLGLFIDQKLMAKFLFMNEIYKLIINVHGAVVEFGVRWGQNLALYELFRGLYEPYNLNRKIIGFDTFEGFISTHPKDGKHVSKSMYSVTPNYESYLAKILDYREKESPISHIKKYELIKGDATVTLKKYLNEHPETIIAFAYFDFDLYEPTKIVLEIILDHLTKGSVIGFDELNHPYFPGETIALKEVLGLNKYKLISSPFSRYQAYIVIE